MPHRHTLAVTLLTASLGAFIPAPPLRAAEHHVTLRAFSFDPQTVTIAPGDTVIWTNAGTGFHDVRADDGSWASPAGSNFTFSRTFTTPGTVPYHCIFHGSPRVGMFGTVIIEDAGGGGGVPGVIRFNQGSYMVSEGAGVASIAVQRVDGDDGPVTVQYAAAAGSATAGQDFTATSGMLSWNDGEDGSKSFTVPIVDDGATEGNETVLLTLASPGGGATLDPTRRNATLTIQDNDAQGGPPAAPTNLQAVASSSSEIQLSWTDNANDETGFTIERRTIDSTFQEIDSTTGNATSRVIGGLDPATFYLFRVRAIKGTAQSAASNEASAATLAPVAPCTPGATTLCLNDGRFRAELDWRIPDGTTGAGQAVALASAPDSGLFYFFSPTNIEMLLKVLDACVAPFDHYWVFFAATTNVEFALVVTDTLNGTTKPYHNPLGRSAPPVQDVSAFATCP